MFKKQGKRTCSNIIYLCHSLKKKKKKKTMMMN